MPVYPESNPIVYDALPANCADVIIEKLEQGMSRDLLIGYALQGSNNVPSFYALYDAIIKEGRDLTAISPYGIDYDDYMFELESNCTYLDHEVFYLKLLESKGCETYEQLQSKYEVI